MVLLCAICLLVPVATGTGGFTAAGFDRTAPVTVGGGESHLGVTTHGGLTCGPGTALTLYNRFSAVDLNEVEVVARNTSAGIRVDGADSTAPIRAGKAGTVRVRLAPTGAASDDSEWVDLVVHATGGDTAVGFVRRVPVSCQRTGIEFVTLCGDRNTAASVSAVGTDGTATPTGVSLDGQGITSVLYGSDGTAYHLDDTSAGEFREGDGRPLDGRGHTCSDIESGAVSIGTFEYNRTAGTFERTHA
jgi:hypothetical protein